MWSHQVTNVVKIWSQILSLLVPNVVTSGHKCGHTWSLILPEFLRFKETGHKFGHIWSQILPERVGDKGGEMVELAVEELVGIVAVLFWKWTS